MQLGFIPRQLNDLCLRIPTRGWNKSRIQINPCATSMTHTAAHWPSRPPSKTTTTRNLMTMYVSSTTKPKSATYVRDVHIVSGRKLLKACYCMALLEGYHQCHSAEVTRDQNSVKWAAEPLRMHYTFLVYGKPISTA